MSPEEILRLKAENTRLRIVVGELTALTEALSAKLHILQAANSKEIDRMTAELIERVKK